MMPCLISLLNRLRPSTNLGNKNPTLPAGEITLYILILWGNRLPLHIYLNWAIFISPQAAGFVLFHRSLVPRLLVVKPTWDSAGSEPARLRMGWNAQFRIYTSSQDAQKILYRAKGRGIKPCERQHLCPNPVRHRPLTVCVFPLI